MTQIFEAIL